MLNDPLANVLSSIINYENTGKRALLVHPVSKVIRHVLSIMRQNGFVGEIEDATNARGGFATLNLLGNVNKCGVIKPRFSVKSSDFEKFEKRYLPAKGVGILIVSTPKGLMTHSEAQDKGFGGRLIAYCY